MTTRVLFAFLRIDYVDVVFFVCVLVLASLLVLIINPLSSWVEQLLKRNRTKK